MIFDKNMPIASCHSRIDKESTIFSVQCIYANYFDTANSIVNSDDLNIEDTDDDLIIPIDYATLEDAVEYFIIDGTLDYLTTDEPVDYSITEEIWRL